MKKLTATLLCLTLICALALPALAGSAHMSISSSSGTVYRGDTFTLTVSLSNDQPVSNGGIVLSYDSSVFELTSGTCHVPDYLLGEVTAGRNGGVFMLQTDAVVSGTIFTINMKVKDNAPFGSYTISGTPSLTVSCSLSGTTVTVGCKHSYGGASKVDDGNHQSTCSICGHVNTEAHTWNSGTVTKAPTCKDTGTKKLTCTACGAEKTETVPVSSEHSFGSWDSRGGDGHIRKCSVCGKEETGDHNWYTVEILEEATCQTTGRKSVACADCGEAAEDGIPLADHTYGAATNVTATQHTHKCTVCGNVSTEDHTFGDTLEHDKQMHYYACQICGYKKDQAEHEPGPKATEETDQVCLVCDRILKPRGAHQHEYMEQWAFDEHNHWHDCVDCPARDAELAHVFDGDCDEDCNVCGMTRPVTHLPLPTLECDETGHWNPCLICGEKQNFAAHTPGDAATVTSAQLCTVCEFEIAPVLPHDHVYISHTHFCACGAEYEADDEACPVCQERYKTFPWWIICILEALIFGGVILYLLLAKKKEAPAYEEASEHEEEAPAATPVGKIDFPSEAPDAVEDRPVDETVDELSELLEKFLAEGASAEPENREE